MKKDKGLKMLKHRLRAHCRTGEVVSVYMDPEDPQLYQSGFVLAVEGKHFLMAEVTANGRYGGYTVFRLKEMFKLEYGGRSEEREQTLYALRSRKHPGMETGGKSLMHDILEYARQNKLVVTLVQYAGRESDLRGYVKALRNGVVELQQVDAYGTKDGVSVCKLDSVTRIYCDGEPEQTVRRLHEYYEERAKKGDV